MKRRVVNETKVLKPVRPSLDDDDWPQFLLINAEVTNVDGQLVNLLCANDNYPVTVTGRLERLDSADQHLCKSQPHFCATDGARSTFKGFIAQALTQAPQQYVQEICSQRLSK